MKKTQLIKKEINFKHTEVFCDKCKNQIAIGECNAFELKLELKVGAIDGYEGFIGTEYSVDFCEDCAKHLFKTIFPENGISINEH